MPIKRIHRHKEGTVDLELTQAEYDEWQAEVEIDKQRSAARDAAAEAKRVAERDALHDIPASVNSVPALRDRVQDIIEILRDRFGVDV